MEIDLITFKTYVPDVTLGDTKIQQYLDDAKQDVIRDGIQSLTGRLLPEGLGNLSLGNGAISLGESSSSSSAINIDKQTGKAGYMARYQEILRKIRAYKGRIA